MCYLLTLSWWRSVSYRNQSTDFWFLYDTDLHKRVKHFIYESFSTVYFLKKKCFSLNVALQTPHCPLTLLTHFKAMLHFYIIWFSDIFREYKNGKLTWNVLDRSKLCSTRLKSFILFFLIMTFFLMIFHIGDFLEPSFLPCSFFENTILKYILSLSCVVTNLACIQVFIIYPVIFAMYTTLSSDNCSSL